MTELIDTIVEAISEKKGKKTVVMDLSELDGAITDAFVICEANSTLQVGAIADGIEHEVQKKLGEKAWRVDGRSNGLWIAIDYIDVVVHIFKSELRDFYKLEELWADAPSQKIDTAGEDD